MIPAWAGRRRLPRYAARSIVTLMVVGGLASTLGMHGKSSTAEGAVRSGIVSTSVPKNITLTAKFSPGKKVKVSSPQLPAGYTWTASFGYSRLHQTMSLSGKKPNGSQLVYDCSALQGQASWGMATRFGCSLQASGTQRLTDFIVVPGSLPVVVLPASPVVPYEINLTGEVLRAIGRTVARVIRGEPTQGNPCSQCSGAGFKETIRILEGDPPRQLGGYRWQVKVERCENCNGTGRTFRGMDVKLLGLLARSRRPVVMVAYECTEVPGIRAIGTKAHLSCTKIPEANIDPTRA